MSKAAEQVLFTHIETAPITNARQTFLAELGRVLHTNGASSNQLERQLGDVSRALGERAQVLSTPTSLLIAFGQEPTTRTALLRVEPGAVDLSKLAELNEIATLVQTQQISARAGIRAVRRVDARPALWSNAMVWLAYVAASASAARFFNATMLEMVLSAGLGSVLGGLAMTLPRSTTTARLFEPLAAAGVALLSALAALVLPVSRDVLMLSGLIVLVPGFTVTVAVQELVTRNLVSGAARMFAAALVFLELGLGVFLGSGLVSGVFGEWTVAGRGAPMSSVSSEAVALGIAALAFGVLFQVRRQDLWALVVVGGATYFTARASGGVVGAEVSVLLASLVAAISARRLGDYIGAPPTVLLIPGIILLVPGSVGFRSVVSLLERDAVAGVQIGFSMMMLATSLVFGLLVADALDAHWVRRRTGEPENQA